MKNIVIAGAGPAGLSTALYIVENSINKDYKITILEKSKYIGGISKTIDYKGNKIDIGGHRFFTKSNLVNNVWFSHFPKQTKENTNTNKNKFLIRERNSKILYKKKFYEYPITLKFKNLRKLGLKKVYKISKSYISNKIHKKKKIDTLEDFFIDKFGKELYETFFKEYTQKVWGKECSEISSEWGAQRIKGVSISSLIKNYFSKMFNKNRDLKDIETSLIDKFYYPPFGPGQFWEYIAQYLTSKGVTIKLNCAVDRVEISNKEITNIYSGQEEFKSDYFVSSIPIKELFNSFVPTPNEEIMNIANGLKYRDFITVGVLLPKINVPKNFKDNWIYVQEPDIKMGRIQIFNNWSENLVKEKNKFWLGLEYFCNESDDFWSMKNGDILSFAVDELVKIGFIKKEDFLDGVVIRETKAYPAYFGTYNKLDELINYIEKIENIYLVGRNGMHRYNNMDHSMLTGFEAGKNILNNKKSNENIWKINSQQEYHE